MKIKTFLTAAIIFLLVGVVLIIIGENKGAYVSLGFSSMMFFSIITLLIIQRRKIKNLDQVYFVLKKEKLLKEYEKLSNDVDSNKLKALSLVYLKLKKDYEKEDLKKFGLWLTNTYSADPSGIDGGIVVLIANIHPKIMEEFMEHIKKQIKEENLIVDFTYGFAYYLNNEEYEVLKKRAINNIKK